MLEFYLDTVNGSPGHANELAHWMALRFERLDLLLFKAPTWLAQVE